MDRPTPVNAFSQLSTADDVTVAPLSVGYFDCGPNYGTSRPSGRSDWLLFLTLNGEGEMAEDGSGRVVSARSATLYHPHATQHYRTSSAAGSWRFRFAHFVARPHWLPWLGSLEDEAAGLSLIELSDDDMAWQSAGEAVSKAGQLLAMPGPLALELAMNQIEAALLWIGTAAAVRDRIDPRLRDAVAFAGQNLHRLVTAEELAEAAGLSASRLNALFRSQLGTSPLAHAEAMRLDFAASLLRSTGMSVKQIAHASGFHDTAHLSRRFKRRFGRSPSAGR